MCVPNFVCVSDNHIPLCKCMLISVYISVSVCACVVRVCVCHQEGAATNWIKALRQVAAKGGGWGLVCVCACVFLWEGVSGGNALQSVGVGVWAKRNAKDLE